MKLDRSTLVLSLLSLVFLGGGLILPFWNRGQSPLLWLLSMTAGSTFALMGVVLSMLSIQGWAGWHKAPRPRGLRLGRKSLGAGALLLALGVLSMIVSIQGGESLEPAFGLLAMILSPILVALGIVLIRHSTMVLYSDELDSPRILTLGNGTYRTGVVLCCVALLAVGVVMLGMIVPKILWKVGFLMIFIVIDSLLSGLALLALGAWICAEERSHESATIGGVQ